MFKEPLALLVFIHQDLADYSKDDLYENCFSWLSEEMESISGRKMLIRLISPEEAPGLTNHPYKNSDASTSLSAWKIAVDNYRRNRPRKDLNPRFNKFLLLTRSAINSQVLGIADLSGYAGIASIEKRRTAAHEVGHMFNAVHQDSEVLYNGWWSETVMKPTDDFSELRHDADRFSDKNRENIRAYLDAKKTSGPTRAVPRPEYDDEED